MFSIEIRGILEGRDFGEVQSALAKVFKVSDEESKVILTKPHIVKKGLEEVRARLITDKLKKLGANAQVAPEQINKFEPAQAAEPPSVKFRARKVIKWLLIPLGIIILIASFLMTFAALKRANAIGWRPDSACFYLPEIKTRSWKKVESWYQCVSNYHDFGESDIAYYVTGKNSYTANNLKLVVNVNSVEDVPRAIRMFTEYSKVLQNKAVGSVLLEPRLQSGLAEKQRKTMGVVNGESTPVSLKTSIQSHSGGYALKFEIKLL